MIGGYDLGTARGKVVVDYSSVGAKKVQEDLRSVESSVRSVQDSVGKTNQQWVAAAAQYGVGIPQIQKYIEVQRAVSDASRTAAFFEANLASARKHSGLRSKESAEAEMMALKARKSLLDITKVLQVTEGNLPSAMASRGSSLAAQFSDSFLDGTAKKLGPGGRGGGLSGILATVAAGAVKGVVAGGVMAALAVATAGVAAVGYTASKGLQRTVAIDQAETKMRALGKTAEEVKSIMNSANESVLKTAYSLDAAATVAAQGIGAKIKPGADLTKYLKEVADAAAVADVSMETMGDIFARIQAGQRAYSEDIMMMSRKGVPIWQALAKEYGVTEAKLRRMVEHGAVDAKTFRKVLTEEIGEVAQKMGNSITGSMQNLNAAISRLGGAALAPLRNVIPAAINGLIGKLDELKNWLATHQRTVAAFFWSIGKFAVQSLQVINNGLASTIDQLGEFAVMLAGILKPIELIDKVSSHLGLSIDVNDGDIRKTIEWLENFSKGADRSTRSLQKNNAMFEKWIEQGGKWVDQFKDGEEAADAFADSADGTTEAAATLEEQLEKLGLSQENIVEAVSGTNAEFQKLLKTLKDKRASDEFVNQVIAMRNAFNKAGPGARDLARALDLLSDKSADATSKADALIKSLKTIGLLPNDDALANFNQTLRELTDYANVGVDSLSKFGNELVNVDNTINTNSTNGEALRKKIVDAQRVAFEAAASGQKRPAEAWQEAHDALLLVLKDFHIVGAQAEAVIQNYLLPQHSFEVQFTQRGGDELRKELTSLFNQIDASKKKGENKVDFRLEVTGDKEELRKKIEELGGSIVFDPLGQGATVHLPPSAVLDDARRRLEDEWKRNTDPLDVPGKVSVPEQSDELVEQATGGKPLELPGEVKLIGDVGGSIKSQINGGKPIEIPIEIGGFGGATGASPPTPPPGIGPSGGGSTAGGWTPAPPATPQAEEFDTGPIPVWVPLLGALDDLFIMLGGGLPSNKPAEPRGTAGQGYFNSEAASKALDLVTESTMGDNLSVTAEQQGRNFAEAFADGILSALQRVNDAALELAQKASEPLGQSPAPYGPLSGKGWTYNRGANFSRAFAAGIVSGSGTVNRASLTLASGSTGTLQEQIGIFLKDYGEMSEFIKHAFDFVSSLGDIAFNVLTLANNLSGGRLFPKTYVKDPGKAEETRKRRQREQDREAIAAQSGSGTPTLATPSGAITPAPTPPKDVKDKKSVAQYIYHSALARGYTPQQAKAILAYGIGESGLNPTVSPGVQTPGLGPVAGIFQMTPEFAKTNGITPEERLTLEGNVKAYLNALEANRNLPIDAFGLGNGALPTTSVGGPLTKEGRQPWGPLLQQAQDYIDQFGTPTRNPGGPQYMFGGAGGRPQFMVPSRVAGLPGRSITYSKQAVRGMGIPQLYTPGEYSYSKGGGGLPDWAYALGNMFNLKTSSSVSASGVDSLHGAGNAFDFIGSPQDMERMAQWLMNSPEVKSQMLQLIYRSQEGRDYEVAGGEVSPGYYGASTMAGHGDHLHGAFAAPVMPFQRLSRLSRFGPAPLSPSMPTPPPSPSASEPVPVTLPDPITNALDSIDQNTAGTNLGLPPLVDQLARQDELLRQSVEMTRNGTATMENATPYLQHLDELIYQQNQLNTDQGRDTSNYLSGIRDNLMGQAGVMEGPDTLGQVQNIAQGTVGLAQDVFSIIDSSMQSVAAANDMANTFARGVQNTEDIYKMVDSIQTFIKLAQDVASTVGDALSFASSIAQASGGQDAGATSMALAAASSVSQIGASVLSAINAGIDLGQEAYRIGTKYLGRFLQDWFGLPGSTDIKYLLDTMNGQLQVYSSDNPLNKTVFNDWDRTLYGAQNYPGREGPQNTFHIYQGPGQDPRDTMSNAMFAIKSSGEGVFGYD